VPSGAGSGLVDLATESSLSILARSVAARTSTVRHYDFGVHANERALLIQKYRDGYGVVMAALEGITDAELDRSDGDGWTPRQIAHHLADSEMMSAIRIRRLLAEPEPVVHGYDEKSFAERLTGDRPIEPSLQAMRWARETCAQLLDRMSDEDWRIVGTHTESGRYGTEDWLRIYAAHGHDHAAQISRARGKT